MGNADPFEIKRPDLAIRELYKSIRNITHKMFVLKLRELESDGLEMKKVYYIIPTKVSILTLKNGEYRLRMISFNELFMLNV
jgi:DNA-binding HxlR family transcriptional regulator